MPTQFTGPIQDRSFTRELVMNIIANLVAAFLIAVALSLVPRITPTQLWVIGSGIFVVGLVCGTVWIGINSKYIQNKWPRGRFLLYLIAILSTSGVSILMFSMVTSPDVKLENPLEMPEDTSTFFASTSEWRTIYVDDFSENQEVWPIEDHSDQELKKKLTVEKRYRVEIWSKNGYAEGSVLGDQDEITDFYLTAEVQKLRGFTNTGYGLLFRANGDDSGDTTNYYIFVINNLKQYSLLIGNDRSQRRLINWTYSPYINPGEINKVGILANGQTFYLFINDFYVDRLSDSTYKRGSIGLWALVDDGEDIVVEFDNLRLLAP